MSIFSQNWFLSACPLCLTACEHVGLCDDCARELPYIGRGCAICCHPLLAETVPICGKCVSETPPYDHAVIPFVYAPPVSWLISQLKYHQQLWLSAVLGELLATHIMAQSGPLPECVMPVPLHVTRMRERGFNQSFEIAKIVARKLGIACSASYVGKAHPTPPQTALARSARQKNLRKSFEVKKPLPYQHIALIDDVVTTGTTVCEISKLLKRHRVETIEVWALARTM